MKTLLEHLDDLDRMVDGGAEKPKIRHQIDLVGRIVATNEAEHSRLVQNHEALVAENQALITKNQALVAENAKLIAPSDNSCMSAPIVGEVDLSTD